MSREQLSAFLSIPYGRTGEERVYGKTLISAIDNAGESVKEAEVSIRCAADEVNALVLKESVRKLIDECDFTIAVISLMGTVYPLMSSSINSGPIV